MYYKFKRSPHYLRLMSDKFIQRKKEILSKKDKSGIGEWDKHIVELCEKINYFDNYYTTSSCSGRIAVIKDIPNERGGLFEFVSHDLIDGLDLSEKKGDLKFKSEPPILHVACRSLEDAEELLEKAREVGWKRSGIISLGKNIIVELLSTEKLEFPLMKDGKLLVSEEFLEIVLDKSNENLKKGWEKISLLSSKFI